MAVRQTTKFATNLTIVCWNVGIVLTIPINLKIFLKLLLPLPLMNQMISPLLSIMGLLYT